MLLLDKDGGKYGTNFSYQLRVRTVPGLETKSDARLIASADLRQVGPMYFMPVPEGFHQPTLQKTF